MTDTIHPASFRDPSGFVFSRGKTLYRQVQASYRDDYDRLMNSGLYQLLVDARLLVPHEEESNPAIDLEAYRILCPERLPFISYPYEWCFSQLKDAALATLRIQRESIGRGMSLKDASAYNIQFHRGAPILIDTLSFETYEEGRPWAAYRQFCQHFLAPLALMSKTDVRLGQLLRTQIDGIPLDLASRLLPVATRLNPGLLMHVHLHGAAQKRYEGEAPRPPAQQRMSRAAMLGLIDSLEGTVRKLDWKPRGTQWADYYGQTNYTEQAMGSKRSIVSEMLDAIDPRPETVWDLGANTGLFSRLASERGARAIAWDVDPGAVEKNYRQCKESGEANILPLLQDLTNPSPDLGWELSERPSLMRRGPADATMALALVHHLAIGNNVPLGRIASFLSGIGQWLIVEFVPKTDSQVKRLLATREDIFPGYTREGFENEFRSEFEVVRAAPVPESERTLYLMRRKLQVA